MSEWYYAQDNVPKGPVSAAEIKRMAAAGDLPPSELVWKEGMTDWTEAGSVKELFPDGVPYSASGKAQPRRASEDYDDFGWRRRDLFPIRRGLSTGAKIGIIVGIATGVAAIATLTVVMIVTLRGPSGNGTFSVNLLKDEDTSRLVDFPANCDVEVIVRSEVSHPETDVDLSILDDRTGQEVAFDRSPSKDCLARFYVPVGNRYEIRLNNLGPSSARCVVTYKSIPRRR